MKDAKTLIDLNGKMNPINFKEGTAEQIYKWTLDNFDKLNLNEALTCSAALDHYHIKITGDEDDRMLLIVDLVFIDLEINDCGCSEEEKENCNNIICLERKYRQN